MTRHFHHQRRLVIEEWMMSNFRHHGPERYDDLHIDRIDEEWGDRAAWINEGLEAFRTAVELRDLHKLNYTVALTYSLTVHERLPASAPRTMADLMAQIDWSPPSLYLFQKGREPWVERAGVVAPIKSLVERSTAPIDGRLGIDRAQWYYMEFVQDGRPYRSVSVAS